MRKSVFVSLVKRHIELLRFHHSNHDDVRLLKKELRKQSEFLMNMQIEINTIRNEFELKYLENSEDIL